MILLSHTGGHRNGRHVARALNRAGLLGEFWTCGCSAARGQNHGFVPEPITGDSLTDDFAPGALNTEEQARHDPRLSHSLDLQMSRRLEESLFKAVYAYQDGADECFRVATRRGVLQLYDLPLGHPRAACAMFEEEAALEPDWAMTLPRVPGPEMIDRQDSELEQTGLGFVTSLFGLRTLDHAPALPGAFAVIPYGASTLPPRSARPIAPRAPAERLRVLFAGELGQHRGLSYLFRACREMRGAVSLTVIGARPPEQCPALERELREVHWRPPCSTGDLFDEMALHDVLVSPSIYDPCDFGFLEGMAAGLPVIATSNTAAADMIDDGVEGFIVPARSISGLVEKFEWLRRNPAGRAEMAAHARQRASRHSWADYERMLAASVTTALAFREAPLVADGSLP